MEITIKDNINLLIKSGKRIRFSIHSFLPRVVHQYYNENCKKFVNKLSFYNNVYLTLHLKVEVNMFVIETLYKKMMGQDKEKKSNFVLLISVNGIMDCSRLSNFVTRVFHTVLTVQELSWNSKTSSRVIFIVLDSSVITE